MFEQIVSFFKVLFIILFNPIVLIPILIVVLINYTESKKFKKESYYNITKKSYFSTRYNTGRYGEYLIYKYLQNFEYDGAKFLFNIYVPKRNEETTEIDVLMISRKGLFVFESKNYSGWIFGSENQKYWYQTLPKGRRRSHKESFYNPIFQNSTHVKYLKSLIETTIPIFSVIVFSDRCTLKNINLQKSDVYVVNRYNINKLISHIFNNSPDILDNVQIEKIFNDLYPFTHVDEQMKQQHINNINNHLIGRVSVVHQDSLINNIETKDESINNENEKISDIDAQSIQDEKDSNNSSALTCPLCG